jgi:iron complex transport system substrate-binding protein
LAEIVKPHRRVRAIIYSAGGWTHGADSIDEDVLRLVGASNIATMAGIEGVGTIDLEQLVEADPELIIVETNGSFQPSLAAQLLEHPVLQSPTIRRLEMPMQLWECIDGSLVDAVQRIEDALP